MNSSNFAIIYFYLITLLFFIQGSMAKINLFITRAEMNRTLGKRVFNSPLLFRDESNWKTALNPAQLKPLLIN